MIGYLIAFAIGALASFAPALFNLLGGGQQQATNAALGNPSAATYVSIITIIGIILLLVGLITFKGTQMVVGVILIIFAPQIASYIVNPPTIPVVNTTTPYPYYTPNPTTPYPTTPYPTTPSQTDKCLIDPLNLCPELESVWTDLSLRIGEYIPPPIWSFPRSGEGIFVLIKTDKGWYWGGSRLQSVLTINTSVGTPTIEAIYIYLLGYNPGDSLYLIYWVDLTDKSVIPVNQYRILDSEYQEIKVNNKIQLVAVLKPGNNLNLNKFDYNKEYDMTITVKPMPKLSVFRGDVYFMYTVKVKKVASDSTSTTTASAVSSQNPFAYIQSSLQVAPPEYDINTGVNLQVLSAVISLAGLLISVYTMNKMKGKHR